jgi:glucose/arabinose dehydrogenase
MPPGTTADHQDVIAEWRVPNPSNPASVVDPLSRRELMRIDHPQFNHNAGDLNFGPDQQLYITDGDGGGADDQDMQIHPAPPDRVVGHQVDGNGQKLNAPLGKVLRIDPLGNNSANGQYGIPADNPFFGMAGALGEIYAFGFRNPFRFSFDSATGDLYLGDVGQNDIEEVNIVVSGGNYGWNCREGTFFFDPRGFEPGSGMANPDDPGRPGCDVPTIDPIAQYDTHNEGHSVIGGFVYHGSRIPQLRGRYVFGDFSRDFVNRVGTNGRLFYLQQKQNPDERSRDIKEFRLVGQDRLGLALFGFGQDHSGELYVLGNATGIPFPDRTTGQPTGVVQRIAPRNR